MNKIFSIAWKDVMQIIREWKSLFFMLVMPVAFTLFFGLVFNIEDENREKGGGQESLIVVLEDEVDAVELAGAGKKNIGSNAETEDIADRVKVHLQGRTFTLQATAGNVFSSDPGEETAEKIPSGFTQSSPGMIIQFTVLGLIATSMILLYERKSKTLGRMIAAPVGFTGIIAGHTLAMFIAVFIQQIILVIIGRIVFKVPYFSRPVPLLLLLFFFALWATSLGVLISTLARKEEQVVTLSIICMFIFSAFGGAWFPLEIAGQAFSTIGHIFPTAWAMDGLQNIILRGKGIETLTYPFLVCVGYTLLFFIAASLRLRRLRAEV